MVSPKRKSKNSSASKKPEPWFVYIIECRDHTLYTGISNNVKRRYANHCAGRGARYTRSHPPLALRYIEKCKDRKTAMKREIAVKRLSRIKKLALIEASPL